MPDNLCERDLPPVQTLAEGHSIKCHLANDTLQQMEPVISFTKKEAVPS